MKQKHYNRNMQITKEDIELISQFMAKTEFLKASFHNSFGGSMEV